MFLAFVERPYLLFKARRLIGVDPPLVFEVVVAMVMMLAMRGGSTASAIVGTRTTMDKTPRKYDIFRLSTTVCQLDRKPFFGRHNIV